MFESYFDPDSQSRKTQNSTFPFQEISSNIYNLNFIFLHWKLFNEDIFQKKCSNTPHSWFRQMFTRSTNDFQAFANISRQQSSKIRCIFNIFGINIWFKTSEEVISAHRKTVIRLHIYWSIVLEYSDPNKQHLVEMSQYNSSSFSNISFKLGILLIPSPSKCVRICNYPIFLPLLSVSKFKLQLRVFIEVNVAILFQLIIFGWGHFLSYFFHARCLVSLFKIRLIIDLRNL